jgi:hypothetical protein
MAGKKWMRMTLNEVGDITISQPHSGNCTIDLTFTTQVHGTNYVILLTEKREGYVFCKVVDGVVEKSVFISCMTIMSLPSGYRHADIALLLQPTFSIEEIKKLLRVPVQ